MRIANAKTFGSLRSVKISPQAPEWLSFARIRSKTEAPEELSMRNGLLKDLLISSSLLLLPLSAMAHNQRRTFVVDGRLGQATVAEIGGHPYVEIAALAEITHGSLSFKADRIILSLPPSGTNSPAAEPPAEPSDSAVHSSGLSREFMRAGIEEIATMREWASTLAYAMENGYPMTEEWATNQ